MDYRYVRAEKRRNEAELNEDKPEIASNIELVAAEALVDLSSGGDEKNTAGMIQNKMGVF